MKDWWLVTDAEKFKSKAEIISAQYSQYTLLDTVHINGLLTLSENIADLGGLNIAYDAFKLTRQGQSNEKVDGLTPDQRFFLGAAQLTRIVVRPEFLRFLLNVDVHAPFQYRIIGILSNFEPF